MPTSEKTSSVDCSSLNESSTSSDGNKSGADAAEKCSAHLAEIAEKYTLGDQNDGKSDEHQEETVARKRKLTGGSSNADDSREVSDYEQDFTWEDYLEETLTVAAPHSCFQHVEHSLENGIQVGMHLEVPNRETPDQYWIATVIMNCGPLLSLRYLGYGEDRSNDFWWDIGTNEFHPVGWCKKNNKALHAPLGVRTVHTEWKALLVSKVLLAVNQSSALRGNGTAPVDLIKQGMKVEVQDEKNLLNVWITTIIENVGGRLLLRYDGLETANHDFWLFYLSHRVHLLGWCDLSGDCSYNPPTDLASLRTSEEWNEIKESSLSDENSAVVFPMDILQPQEEVSEHQFVEGMKLEVVNPNNRLHLYPGTVCRVLSSYYFMVEIDDFRKDTTSEILVCCHSASATIFPIDWAKKNGIKLYYPKGYMENPDKEFDWDEYLKFCNAIPAPNDCFLMNHMNMGFEVNMKLEAVNPFHPHHICAASISKVVEPLLWIQLDSADTYYPHHIETLGSLEIFPVGWCESNGYQLKPPRTSHSRRQRKMMKRIGIVPPQELPQKGIKTESSLPSKENSKAWCPKIYFNHKCFSGPFLSKGRLAELPRHIGPGSVSLVMKEVLSSLINVAYKSSRVLKELQLRGKPDPTKNQEVLKAKYKGKSYRAVVEIVRRSEHVEDFCKSICSKLECCPYLFGPKHVGEDCPENCYKLTKTKFVTTIVKKRKVGRPPLLLSQCKVQPKSPGRRRKRKTLALLKKQSSDSNEDDPDTKTPLEETSFSPPMKRKYKPFVLPKTSMITRGAKLPNFSLEMKWRRQRVKKLISPDRTMPRRVGRPPLASKTKPVVSVSKTDVKPETVPTTQPKIDSETAQDVTENVSEAEKKPAKLIKTVHLATNPLSWSVEDVFKLIKSTDCAPIARALREQEVDGQALLLMTLPDVQEFLELNVGPAIQLCHLIEGIKLAFYLQFANADSNPT